MESLPKEITSEILKNIPGKEILGNCGVNKQFARVCSDDPKYNNLWRQKIEEDFQQVYMGDRAYQEYKYLNRLYSQKLYLVSSYNDDSRGDGVSIVGIYNMYGKAVMVAMKVAEEVLQDVDERLDFEALRYTFWNKRFARIDDYWTINIEELSVDNLNKVYDERPFFANREKLYLDLFGNISEEEKQNASYIPNPFDEKKSKKRDFYTLFDKLFERYKFDRRGRRFDFPRFLSEFEKNLNLKFDDRQIQVLKLYTDKLAQEPMQIPRQPRRGVPIIGSPRSPRSPAGSSSDEDSSDEGYPYSPKVGSLEDYRLPLVPGSPTLLGIRRPGSPIGSPRSPRIPSMIGSPRSPQAMSPRSIGSSSEEFEKSS